MFCTTIREVLLTPTHLGFVLEYEAGGSLVDLLADRMVHAHKLDLILAEEEARFLFKVRR